MTPQIYLVSNLVHYGHQDMVESVMVDGQFLIRDRNILCFDEKAMVKNAQAATASAWRRLQVFRARRPHDSLMLPLLDPACIDRSECRICAKPYQGLT